MSSISKDGKFTSLTKDDLGYIADKANFISDVGEGDNRVILEIDDERAPLEGFYFEHGHLILTTRPVRPRND